MKASVVANIALVLAIVAWPLLYFGVLSQIGDPILPFTHEQAEASRHQAIVMLLLGIFFLFSSLVLAGYAFSTAKLRASVAVAAVVAPATAAVLSLW